MEDVVEEGGRWHIVLLKTMQNCCTTSLQAVSEYPRVLVFQCKPKALLHAGQLAMASLGTLNDIERLDLLLLKLDNARFALPAVLRALSGNRAQSSEELLLEYRNKVSNATSSLDELQTGAVASAGALLVYSPLHVPRLMHPMHPRDTTTFAREGQEYSRAIRHGSEV